ncbi:MAG: DUF2191 domain-containing protein [Candidatus Eremiobacteraeota bacterium]|nr:DUF2191 domain-containing protein [Candidatus Eremiobacteraeota bacterium]MCW5869074.1 DUF2191 domain-containing protein [Candidatus Eremiobacteraeota bacterium]
MRTTLNIHDSLLRKLQVLAQEEGVTLTAIANRALELGVARLSPPVARTIYEPPVFDLGEPVGYNLDKATQLADALEDGEILRKLGLRK